MPFPPPNLSKFHNDVLHNTLLGKLFGTKKLFRDRYLILRLLGRGGFGVTFLARDLTLPGKPFCVIKQLCPRVSEQKALDTARLRFKREAKILSALGNHSRIPMLLDYFVMEGDFYLIQEYVRGATLARLVRRQGCQSEVIVKRVLRETLELLDYVHSQGVIHRDVKPQNIILAQDRRLVLIDFGAVKEQLIQIEESSSCKGVTTHFVGTVGFAPPEQFSLRPVYASDLYALGVTCLYLLTGKAPLDFKT
ncbi:MAG: serine/threonine protein kinase, partial [Kamptonema sp. SIO4C4]|nr:serine/threonine protein kinase [Kamptonema sp. SIO4C4]